MTLWQIWHDKNPPNIVAKCLETAKIDYPEQVVLSLTEAKVLSKIGERVDLQRLARIPIPNQTTIIRWAILYEHGGMYLDADYISLKRYEPEGDCCLYDQEPERRSCAFVACEPKHPIIEQALDVACERFNKLEIKDGGRYWGFFGSEVITEVVEGASYTKMPSELIQPLSWKDMARVLSQSDLSEIPRIDECYGIMLAQTAYNRDYTKDSVMFKLLDRKLNNGC